GIHRHPAVVLQEHLGPAMLRLADGSAPRAERLVAERRGRHPDSVEIAGRNPDGAQEADEERVDVATLPAEILGLEHRFDVADAAPPYFRLPVRVRKDPVVDRLDLVNIRGL